MEEHGRLVEEFERATSGPYRELQEVRDELELLNAQSKPTYNNDIDTNIVQSQIAKHPFLTFTFLCYRICDKRFSDIYINNLMFKPETCLDNDLEETSRVLSGTVAREITTNTEELKRHMREAGCEATHFLQKVVFTFYQS